MSTPHTTVHNPAGLLLRITRSPAGLHLESPQLPGWSATARGPVPIAQAVDAALTQVECDAYAGRRGRPSDLAAWDAACESFAASGNQLLATDVVVVRNGTGTRRSGRLARARGLTRVSAVGRPAGKFVPQHDPFAWTDLGNGQWRAPGGAIYAESTRQVQGVIARRAERVELAAVASAGQLSLGEVS